MSDETLILQTLYQRGLLTANMAPKITVLTGGFHNDVYRLRCEITGIDWVVKQFVSSSTNPLFPVLPDDETAALKMFDGEDVAPSFVAYIPDTVQGAMLVYEFIQGDMWQQGVGEVAELLAKIHALPIQGEFRRLLTSSVDIVSQTRFILSQMKRPAPAEALLKNYLTPSARIDVGPDSLIHTDCGPGNIIVGAQGPRLIDWQCPGIGDPVEDLVNFSSPAMQIIYRRSPLNETQRQAFFTAYDNQKVIDRLQQIGRSYHIRLAAYCLYRIQELEQFDPDISLLYQSALDAEMELIESWDKA